MVEWTDKDELKAILALGIIAGIGIIYQLEASHVSIVQWTPRPAWFKEWAFLGKGGVLFAFTTYIFVATFALGLEYFEGSEGVTHWLHRAADFLFFVGALSLIALAVGVTIRVVVQL